MTVSELRVSLPQLLAVSVKNIILIAFGMTLGFPTVLIPALQDKPGVETTEDFVLNSDQISWISSINLICVPLGCIFSGSFTAILGRRRAMQLSCLPIIVSWFVFYFSQNVYHLYLALCLSGFTGGMLEAPVLTYVAEISTPKLRGILAATGSFCIILGIFSQFLMGLFLKWRMITLVSTIVPTVALFCLFFVPESPYWLMMKKREEEAKKSLMWLRGWRKSFESVKQEFDELYKSFEKSSSSGENEESLLRAFMKRTFIFPYFICTLAFFIGHFSGMTTLQTYAVPIFTQLKAPVDKYFATMLLGIVELIGTAMCVLLVRFVGKRKLTFVSAFGCSFCFFSTAIYAYFIESILGFAAAPSNVTESIENIIMNETTTTDLIELWTMTSTESAINSTNEFFNNLQFSSNEYNETGATVLEMEENKYSWIPLTLLLASALLSHSGIRLLPWMLIGEVYPGRIRGIASGITGGTSYVLGFLVNKIFLSMVATLTLPGTFLLYSCVSVAGCIVLFILLPETEGRTLQEIENHFTGKRKLPKTMKRKEPVSDEPFPEKFDIHHWESNDKFEKSLQQHKISHILVNDNGHHRFHKHSLHHYEPHQPNVMGVKRKNDTKPEKNGISLEKNGTKIRVNDRDYDTPL